MGGCITKDNYYSPIFTYIPPKNNSTISYITYASCTSIGYMHMKNENQDRGGVSLNPGGGGTRFVAFVFDGHGEFGSAVVEYALEEFPEILHKHIQLSSVRPQFYLPQKEVRPREESHSSMGDYSSLSQKYTNQDSSCRLSSKITNSTHILPLNSNLVNPLQTTNISVLPAKPRALSTQTLSNSYTVSPSNKQENTKNKRLEKSISIDKRNKSKKSILHESSSSSGAAAGGGGEHIKYKESHRYLSLDRVVHQSSGKYLRNDFNTAFETGSNGRNYNNHNLSPSDSVNNLNNNISCNNEYMYNNNNNTINGDILCEIMKHSFLDLHNNMIENSNENCSLEMSGCTATSIMIEGNTLISSNVGDSRALLCRRNNENKYFGVQITTDHRVSVPKERARIEECGGCVFKAPHKGIKGEDRMWVKDCLYPGLMVSRSLGDSIAHEIGNITMPDTVKMELTVNDDIIIIGSDGIWDVLDNDQVIDIINTLRSEGSDVSVYCKELLKFCLEGWKIRNASDNIYITVVMLHHNQLI